MTTSTTPSTATTVPGRKVAPPPGILFGLVTAGSILLGLAAHLNQSFSLLLRTILAWPSVGASWLFLFVIVVLQSRGHMPAAHWARWLAVPLVMGLAFALTRTSLLLDARFQISRGALDSMAADIAAGGSLERGWVGLYNVGTAERTANGFRFVINDEGLGRWGIAFSPQGEPQQADEDDDGERSFAWFEPLGGPWWVFRQSWD